MPRLSRQQKEQTRRDFLRADACAACTTQALVNTVWDLRLINAALAAGSPEDFTDYKALVCLFLYGGNDANNMVVPTGAVDYANYQNARGVLALPLASLLPITVANSDGRTWGLHPNCPELQSLFNNGKLAIVANVGTLVGPITLQQYQQGTAAKPPQLFSHNDQQVQWMTSIPDQPPLTGWGGRCADLLMSAAYNANPNTDVSMSITVGGTNTFEVGSDVNQYSVSSNGTVTQFATGAGGASRLQVMRDLFNDAAGAINLFQAEFGKVSKIADDNAQAMGKVFNNALNPPLTTVFPNSSLGNQLRTIARIIKAKFAAPGNIPEFAGFNRQIFFASVGGYDTHGDQLVSHANLLNELSEGVNAFYNALTELGLADKVTTFTASDFGRTFSTNGGGSDHAWGSHQIVMGDAVTPGAGGGGNMYGTMPAIALGNSQDVGQGRWIPTTAVDQYSATLAKWFGVSDGDMNTIFPNLPRFTPKYMDFLQET
jgi:uncharacterized protein (DUF1501 family)